MKITQTRLKQIIQEELAAIQETFGSKPPPPSASREEVNKVVAELFNVAANLQMLGEDFFSDYDSLDAWIGAFMEKHNILQEGELEENFRDSDARIAKKMKQRDEERAKASREKAKKAGGYYRADGTFVPRRD